MTKIHMVELGYINSKAPGHIREQLYQVVQHSVYNSYHCPFKSREESTFSALKSDHFLALVGMQANGVI